MARVEIICPSCGEKGGIEISNEAVKDVARGLLAVNIANQIICKHTIIAYVDKNFHVRDYFVADFRIEIPEITHSEMKNDLILPKKEVLDVDLIKLNLTATLLTYIIKSIFFKQTVAIISDQEFLHNHILNFFKYITQDSFEIDISIIIEEKYKSNKKSYKNSIVLQGNKLLRNNKNIINPKKLLVEKQIVSNFMHESELGYGYIVLRNEIRKAYTFSKEIFDFIEKNKKDEVPNALKIKSYLEETYHVKISNVYMNFLIEIVNNYFGITLPSLTESFFDIL